MKKLLVPFIAALIFFSSCCVEKSYYQTKIGKKKQKYYNDLQFGANKNPKRTF